MYVFKVEGMNCMSCVRNIDEALKELDTSLMPSVDLKEKTVKVESKLDQNTIARAIEEAGYDVTGVTIS